MIFEVVHLAFCTDDLRMRTTLVEADSAQEALEIYNAEAERLTSPPYMPYYPYGWNKVTIDNVHEAEILRK